MFRPIFSILIPNIQVRKYKKPFPQCSFVHWSPMNNPFYHNYCPQRSCDKVMFLHLSVILFTGVCGRGVWQTPPAQCMLGYTAPRDTANKRAVRILLECILVATLFCSFEFPWGLIAVVRIFNPYKWRKNEEGPISYKYCC